MCAAVVTGGSQGVGKGIVEGLAEAGHEVFFTGRNESLLAETEKSAAMLGGEVCSERVDHAIDSEVVAFFEKIANHHTLDLLVNNVWGGYEKMVEDGQFTWTAPFWSQPLHRWDSMMNNGVRAAFVSSQLATKIMLAQAGGLIINISFWSAQKHIGNTLYGMAKSATDKMTADMAAELIDKDITVISLYPGLVRTEKVMASAAMLDLSNSESPLFIGRTIAALKANTDYAKSFHGKVCIAANAAKDLGVVDIDGTSPHALSITDV